MKPYLTRVIAFLAGAWRYRWQGLAACWAVCLIGWLGIWAIPDQYAVQAIVYIDTDNVLGPLMRGLTVPEDQDQQVAIMLKSMTTRPNLEQIVRLVNPNASKMTPADLEKAVAVLNKNIQMEPEGVKNLFGIGYVDNNSVYAETVTQSLLSILVNSNVGDARRDILGARSFIDQKISEYQAQLRDAEERRAAFKAANLDAISTTAADGGAGAAQAELMSARNDLGAAEVTVANLRTQLTSIPQTIASDQLPTVSDRGTSGGSSSLMALLAQDEQKLIEMRSRYTDDYPDVISLKQDIAQLEKEVAQANDGKGPPSVSIGVPNPVYVDVRNRLSNAEVQLALLQHRTAVATEKLATTKKNMVEILGINNKYADLDRDYSVIESNYNALVKSREAARMSQSMSDQQESISYRVIEPPKRTQYPISPPRTFFNALVLLLGLAAGVGLAVLLKLFSGRFATSEELAEYFSLPVIGVVSEGANPAITRREQLSVTLLTVGFLTLIAIYGAVSLFLTTSIFAKLGI